MAIPTVRSVGTYAAFGGDISPAIPSGFAENDIGVMLVETYESDPAPAPPTGWSEATNSPQVTDASGNLQQDRTRLSVFWIRRGVSDPSTTITDVGNHQIGQIIAIQGCVTTGDPFDVTAGSVANSVSSTGTIPGPTTTVADTLVLACIGIGYDVDSSVNLSSWTNANLSSLTEQMDQTTAWGNGGGFGMASGGKASTGAVGDTTVTISTGRYRTYWCGALKPAGASTQTITPVLTQQLTTGIAPTVTTGTVDITPGLVQQLAAAFGPVVATGAVTITPALVQQLTVGIAPTVTVGTVIITPSLVQQLAVGIDPTVAAVGATQDITPILVQRLATGIDPVLTQVGAFVGWGIPI